MAGENEATKLITLANLQTYTSNIEKKNVQLLYADYLLLPNSKLTNGISYYITDKNVIYKNGVCYGEGNGEPNVQSDWNVTDDTSDAFIKNKPTIPTVITYTLTQDPQDGHKITFTPSSGTATTITIPDNNTTYSNLNEFSNADTKFITNAVNDLTNYYKKTETYTQAEVNALISAIPKFSIEVVDSLLIDNPSPTTIYLLLNTTTSTQNLYTEYIYIIPDEGEPYFEKLGEQTVDLSGYYTSTQVDTLLSAKVDTSAIGAAAAKGVDTSISAGSTSVNLPTSGAVASFVEGKGYVTTDTNTTYSLSVGTGDDANKIILTPSSGTAEKITVPYATDAGTVNGKTVGKSVPSDAVFTDTTYSLVGTENTTGLVKNGSAVTDATGYTPSPIINGIPYYQDTQTITGVKGDAESTYRTGNVNITPANIGAVATETGKGLSSNDYTDTEKSKLSGIDEGAEVNQNAFSSVTIGSITISSANKTDTLTLDSGNKITLTPDLINKKVTIASDADNVFQGTTEEWEALTTDQKKAYDGVLITDDYDAPDHMDADEVDFSNTGTSLVSTDVQSALVEIANSMFSGNYNDLSNKPTLGTASSKDVASSGDASSTQVVMGNDSRLSDSRNAKDVYSWAKASSKPSYTASEVGAIATSAKGTANGVAELDANGLVPSSQLPSYVDDILEYSSLSEFPATGETGKIYVATDTNLTYRWSGSAYVEISPSLALGETSSTAYRGDRGKTAYDHATDSSRLTTAQTSGLYKIATTAEGHVASVTAVQKSDITALGIPESDTNTIYTLSAGSGDDAQKVILTPSSGDAQKVTVPYATNAGDASTVNGKTVAVNVPSDAVFTDTKDADSITYSNTTSGLSATNVQNAIDELKSNEDYSKYIGTSTDWDQLSTAEKKKYDLAFITND